MAVTNSTMYLFTTAGLNLSAGTYKAALLTASHVTNVDTQIAWSNVSANEITGTGYTANGVALTNVTITQDNTSDVVKFDADDAVWAALTASNIRYVCVYLVAGGGSSYIVAIIDFGVTKASTGGSFTVQWNTGGIVRLRQL